MKKLMFSLLFATSLFSCNHDHHESYEMSVKNVELNNGMKWDANLETTQGIENMIALVQSAISSGNSDIELLKTKLEHEFTTIFKKCTMKGESHNQLHNYLLPLKTIMDNLDNSSSVEDLKSILVYLKEYDNYFS